MNIFINPPRDKWQELCERAVDDDSIVRERTRDIVSKVKSGGDAAVRALTEKIDGYAPDCFRVTAEEIAEASARIPDSLKKAIAKAAKNISAFHAAQLPKTVTVETTPEVLCIQRPVPVSAVGLYIPGGTAPLFSTVLMLALPAKIAGCKRIVMCTPCSRTGQVADAVLYAATVCGVTEIYKIGGAVAIASMAYGTETIAPVNKIFGPGNRYVTTAKQLVSMDGTAIDMPAGPSEVMVLCDEASNPDFVAADLLSQCEHGIDSQAIAVCNSKELAKAVEVATMRQAAALKRAEYIEKSLGHSRIIVLDTIEDMLDFANQYAPEHLILAMSNPIEVANNVTAAGSVFIGNYAPESAGDYASGTNHTLPTAGWAASLSGVNIDSFMRKMTLQYITSEGLKELAPTIVAMAEAEGLDAHANAVKIRIDEKNN